MWTLGWIADALNRPCNNPEIEVTGRVITDSREVKPGGCMWRGAVKTLTVTVS